MTTLIERKNNIAKNIFILKQGDHHADDIKSLETRQRQINKYRGIIERCLEQKKSFLDYEIDCQINTTFPPQFKKDLEEKINQCKDNLDKITKLNVDEFFSPLQIYSKEINANLIAYWQKFVGYSPIGSDVINVLKKVAGYEEKMTRLSDAITILDSARNTTNITKTLIEKVRKAQEEIKKIDNEFKGIPSDVMEFLKKASGHQTQYSDLTDEIKKWLSENDILDSLKISL